MRSVMLALVVALAGAGLAGCGPSSPDEGSVAGEPATGEADVLDAVEEAVVDCDVDFVPAGEVEVVGSLTADETAIVDWALSRFAEAELLLPARIEIGFDPTRSRCAGARGLCISDSPTPAAIVCEPLGSTMFRILNRRITMLHELAHLWHAGGFAPDAQEVVGGEITDRIDGSDVAWEDRTTERVAMVISWGLLDQLRRQVGMEIPCVDIYRQFVALTGREPLGPLEIVCVPPEVA